MKHARDLFQRLPEFQVLDRNIGDGDACACDARLAAPHIGRYLDVSVQ